MRRAILTACLVAGLASPALAHAFLEAAAPAAGDNLRVSPAVVDLRFSEPLEPAFSGIEVASEAGQDVTGGPASVDGAEMKVALKHLAPGRYRVRWHAVSVDTHRTEGLYNFLVLP